MLIGLDGIPLTFPKTGVGHYTAQLARALATIAPQHEFRLLYPSSFAANSFRTDNSAPANVTSLRIPVGPVARHWWSVGLPRYLLTNKLHLFHGTNYDVPLWRRCPTVLTIHDLSTLLHSQTHEKRSVKRAKRRLPLMSKTADAIIVPTAAVGDEVINYLGASEHKVFVIAEAAREFFQPIPWSDTVATRQKLGIGDHFILTVGTIEPRKNLATLVSAFESLSSEKNLQLVIAGGQGWLSTPSMKAIEQSPARARIVLTDYLHDEDLRSLYSSCRVFVYPSLYEGFGLPPIEAMACGAAVVISNIRSLVESTGGVAKVAAPEDAAAFTEVIQSLLDNEEERRQLSEAGRARAAQLTWQDAARKTLEVYERVLS